MPEFASRLDAIPLVTTTAERGTLFPSPSTGQRVQNLETGAIERYTGSAWVAAGAQAGVVSLRSFGAVGDGVTDDTVAIQAAVDSGEPFVADVGATYIISDTIEVTLMHTQNWNSSVVKAAASFPGTELFLINTANVYAASLMENLRLDFNSQTGIDGIRLIKANTLTFRRVRPVFLSGGRYLFYCDCTTDQRILDILWDTCVSYRQKNGWRFIGSSPQTTSFDCFTLLNCQVESDGSDPTSVCIYAQGEGNNRLILIGGDYESAGDACLVADGFTVENGAYMEPAAGGLYGRSLNGAHIHHNAGTNALIGPAHWSTDSTSTHSVGNRQLLQGDTARGTEVAGARDGARAYAESAALRDKWGPPNYPTTKSGFSSLVGMTWRDMQGVKWTCTQSGTTNGSPKPRWCALDGTIIIPLDYTQITNGGRQLNVQGDFEVESVDFYVTTTFSGGTSINFGTATSVGQIFISSTQGAVANLVAGTLIRGVDNQRSDAVFSTPGARHRIVGKEFDAVDDSGISSFISGTFSAGAGVLIVKGRYLIDPATGYPTFGVASSIEAPTFAPLRSITYDFVETATGVSYVAALPIPAGANIHEIQVDQRALWAATGSATLKIGDTADDDGYFTGVNLKATDLLVGEQFRLTSSENWGGRNGAYLVAATGQRGPVASNYGGYYATGSNLLATVTVVTPNASPTGRTRVTVIYSVARAGTVTVT